MSLPNVSVKIGDKSVTLSLPIGALEEVAEVNPYPEELWNAFLMRQYSVKEVKATMAAALKWGGSDLDVEDVINGVGLSVCADWCAQALEATIRDTGGKKRKAVARREPAS